MSFYIFSYVFSFVFFRSLHITSRYNENNPITQKLKDDFTHQETKDAKKATFTLTNTGVTYKLPDPRDLKVQFLIIMVIIYVWKYTGWSFQYIHHSTILLVLFLN